MSDIRPAGLINKFKYAYTGLVYCIASQWSMKVHVVAAAAALAMAFYFELTKTEFLILILTIAGVMAAEMINTAVESVTDILSPEYHPLAKVAKDVAAGAVLIMACFSLAVGYLLFFHRIFG